MPRLYVALHIPSGIATQLGLLREELAGTRWSPTYHLTTNFIGDVDRHAVTRVAEQLGALDAEQFKILLSACSAFPNRTAPRALWVGVDDEEPLRRLRASVGECIDAAGVEWDTVHFSPHVTLARIKRESPTSPIAAWVERYENWHSYSMLADAVYLHATTMREGRAVDAVVAKVGLRAAPD